MGFHRPVVKALQSAASTGKETMALMQVHSATKAELKGTVTDMKAKLNELEAFIDKTMALMATASVHSPETPGEQVKATRELVEAALRIADTHKAGMQVVEAPRNSNLEPP